MRFTLRPLMIVAAAAPMLAGAQQPAQPPRAPKPAETPRPPLLPTPPEMPYLLSPKFELEHQWALSSTLRYEVNAPIGKCRGEARSSRLTPST